MKKIFVSLMMLWAGAITAQEISRSQVVIIAHKSVPADTISSSRLLDFYTCDIQAWSDNQPVFVLDLKSRSEAKDTFYHFLGKSPSRMKSIWMKKMLSGEGDPPESFHTEEELLKKVANTPGAIGYVSRNMVRDSVKVLAIIDIPSR